MLNFEMTKNGYYNFEWCLYDLIEKGIEGKVKLIEVIDRTTFNFNGRKDTKYTKESLFEIKGNMYKRIYKTGREGKFKKAKKVKNNKL